MRLLNADDTVASEGFQWNLITNVGRQFLHQQGYQKSGLATNGLCYFGFSADVVTEDATSTTLSNEINANGITRTIADTVSIPTGSGNSTTIKLRLTFTGSQSVQKAALFTQASGGTMSHVAAFEQGTLAGISGQKLDVTCTIFLG